MSRAVPREFLGYRGGSHRRDQLEDGGVVCQVRDRFLGVEGAVRLDEARGDLLGVRLRLGAVSADGWSVAGASPPRSHAASASSAAATPIRIPRPACPRVILFPIISPSQARMRFRPRRAACDRRARIASLPLATSKASPVTTSMTMMPPCRLSGIRATIRLPSGDQTPAGLPSCVRGWFADPCRRR